MYLKKKKRILEIINTIYELLEYIDSSGNVELLPEIETAFNTISSYLEKEDYDIDETKSALNVCENLYRNLVNKKEDIVYEDLNKLFEQVNITEQVFLSQVQVKLNVVFMPYNITMWDSLESIYFACEADKDCDATVVPIPYFDITQDPPIMHCDFDKYDKSLKLVDYKAFDLATQEPDIIYIHNIYDDYNMVTTVLPMFYTENLKKYTDMLVYSPYCIPNFLKPYMEDNHSYTFDSYGAKNVDRFVAAGDFVVEEGKNAGIHMEKILNFGTPKFDSLIKQINVDFEYPEDWIRKSKGKRIVLFSTSLSYFVKQFEANENKVTNISNIIMKFARTIQKFKDEDVFVIWRPHPLTRTLISQNNPEFVAWYDNLCDRITGKRVSYIDQLDYEHVVLDENGSYLPAFKFSDAFLTDYTSIAFSYLMLNKKLIMTHGSGIHERAFDVNKYSEKIGFTEIDGINDFEEYINFKKNDKFELDTELLSMFYKNLDGSSGEKIHKAVKNDVLKNNF